MNSGTRRAATLGMIHLVAACGGTEGGAGAASADGPAVRDSAGVQIVENGVGTAGRGPTFGAGPVWTLGWGDGDPAFVDVDEGLIRDDGTVVVGDAASLHFLGPDGTVVGSAGREGDGPGEYRSISRLLEWPGDSLLVFDAQLARATVLDREGGHGRSFRVEAGPGPAPAAVAPGGSLLMVPSSFVPRLGERSGWVWHDGATFLYDPATSDVDTLAALPFARLHYEASSVSVGPFAHWGFFGAWQGGWTWARNDEREVRWYDFDGALRTAARWDERPAPLTEEVRRAYIERNLAWARENNRDVEQIRRVAEEQLATHEGPLPWFNRLVVSRAGDVWLGHYVAGNDPPTRYRVFDREGVRRPDVETPPRFTILDVRDDLLLGVLRDELDVPAVALFRLRR